MANCRWGIWNCLSEHLFRSSVRCMISTSTLTSPQMERKDFCFISPTLSQHISFCLFIIFATLVYLSYSLYTSVLSELLSKWNLLNVLFLLQFAVFFRDWVSKLSFVEVSSLLPIALSTFSFWYFYFMFYIIWIFLIAHQSIN